jgi:O-acetyl-ADP-ribose deacetylase (regulator of RNase III)
MQTDAEARSSNVVFLEGDLFKSGQQTIVNPINCRGKMGRGLALTYKKKFPAMNGDYEQRCSRNEVKVGEPYLWKESAALWILNFPTKDDWRHPSDISYIRSGLEYLASHATEWGIESLAIPALGCGLGELGWDKVRPLILEYMAPLGIPVKVYEPQIAPKQKKSTMVSNDPIKKRLRVASGAKEPQFLFQYSTKKSKKGSDIVSSTMKNKIS